MEYRYADTFDVDDYACFACKISLRDSTYTSYENPSSHDCLVGKSDHVMVHFRLCIPCGDKIRGTKLTESQKLKRRRMMSMVDDFVKENKDARL